MRPIARMKIRRFCMASGGKQHDPEKCAAVLDQIMRNQIVRA